MKPVKKNIRRKWQQVMAYLLLLLSLSTPVAQAFHHHHYVPRDEQTEDQEYLRAAENKCSLCDYYAHNHGKEMYLSYPPVVETPLPPPVTLGTRVYARIYKFTLQGFSNKGPPLYCFKTA